MRISGDKLVIKWSRTSLQSVSTSKLKSRVMMTYICRAPRSSGSSSSGFQGHVSSTCERHQCEYDTVGRRHSNAGFPQKQPQRGNLCCVQLAQQLEISGG